MKLKRFFIPGMYVNRRQFLTTIGAAAVASKADAQLLPPKNARIVSRSGTPVPPGMLQQSDFTYLGCVRMPAGVDTQFGYGGLTGRRVGNQLRLFVFGRNTSGAQGVVASGQSSSSFILNSGQAAAFLRGDKVV